MSEINIPIEPGHQIEVGGKRYEAIAFRKPVNGEHWLASNGDVLDNDTISQPRLILRLLPARKVPTDKDAAVWPRRKCWVRDYKNKPWKEAKLLSVLDHEFPFSTIIDECVRTCWRYCEIEVEE